MEWIIYYIAVSMVISVIVGAVMMANGFKSAKEPDFVEEFYEEEKNFLKGKKNAD